MEYDTKSRRFEKRKRDRELKERDRFPLDRQVDPRKEDYKRRRVSIYDDFDEDDD